MNADNGNVIVMLDKEEHDKAVIAKLNNGNFHDLRKAG